MKPTAMCKRSDLAPSSAYRYYKCRCLRCLSWKKDAAKRTNDKELAKQRSREWRLKYPERSRFNAERYQKEHPDMLLKWQLRKYGITPEQYKSFGDKCMICGQLPKGLSNSKKRLSVDHDKNTGQVRGVLCGSCNVGLGHFNHDIDLLIKAIKYLRNGDVE